MTSDRLGWSRIREHENLLLLLAAFTVFRLLAAISLRPGGFLALHGANQTFHFEIGRLAGSGNIAFRDFWVEYPPLMPWLAALAYRISLLFPPAGDQIFWFNLWFRLLLLPFDMGTLVLIYATARRLLPREGALQVASLWALVFAPLFTFLECFEPLALFFLVLGLYALLSDRPLLAGLAAGLGFIAKVFPIVALPVAFFRSRTWRGRVRVVGAAALSALIVILPPALAAPQYTKALFQLFLNRSSYETVWALLEGYAGCGAVAPLSSGADPAAASLAVHPATLPWLAITLCFAALYVAVITRSIKWCDKSRAAAIYLFSLALFILYNKGYSPQWATYLSTIALLALPVGRGLGYGLLLDLLMVAEWPVGFVMLEGQSTFLATVIVIRTLVIALLALEAIARAFDARPWLVARKAALPAALAVVVGGFSLVAPSTWRAFSQARLQKEPLAPLIQSLRKDPSTRDPIVIVQPELLERLRPYLPATPIYLFPGTGGGPWARPGEWLPATLKGYDRAWLLYDNADEADRSLFGGLQSWFDHAASPSIRTWFGPVRAAHYVVAPLGSEQPVGAQFGGGLRLVSATAPVGPLQPGAALALQLRWQPVGPLPHDYAVFVQALSPEGRVVAQSDTWPEVPASQWAPSPLITRHGLILPASLPAGSYILVAGLYDASGARLPLTGGGDAANLGTLTVQPPRMPGGQNPG